MAKVIIIYDTAGGNTKRMANAIREGMEESGIQVLLRRTSVAVVNDLTDVDAVVLGCPTYHHDLLPPMKTFLFEMREAGLKGKIGAAFGSYGWSGESVEMMTDTMKHVFEMNVIEPSLKILRTPTQSNLQECKAFGRIIAERMVTGGTVTGH